LIGNILSDEICCAEEMQRLAKLSNIMEKNIFKDKKLTNAQAYLLLNLYKNNNINMQTLSEILEIDISTLTRNISKLIKPGYVIKEKDINDKRVNLVKLTKKGEELAKEVENIYIKHYIKIVCNIPKDKKDIVFEGINILLAIFEEAKNKKESKK
jgi:DNA-binding MarR family transcriptional regulator